MIRSLYNIRNKVNRDLFKEFVKEELSFEQIYSASKYGYPGVKVKINSFGIVKVCIEYGKDIEPNQKDFEIIKKILKDSFHIDNFIHDEILLNNFD